MTGPEHPIDAAALAAIDVTAPAIDTSEGIVTLDGILLALAATVLGMAYQPLFTSAVAVIDADLPDALPVIEDVQARLGLAECLDSCAARHASYSTTPWERNLIRDACNLILSAEWEEPTGIPAQVLAGLGAEHEPEH